MKEFNLIVVIHPSREKILMCRRKKNPYLGKINFVGGRVEPNEDLLEAAYRELFEETSITKQDITLKHLMDCTYYLSDCVIGVYAGKLKREVEVFGEENTLLWSSFNHNFFDMEKYAGIGNIGHILEEVKEHINAF